MALLRGTVTDNQDPLQRGRCRVFIWGMHKEQDPNLPWAETAGSTMFGLHKGVGYSGVLQVGTTVWVDFEQQDIQCPVIVGVFVGHETESPGDVSSENSDFNPDAKGDNYGKVWMFNTPVGNSFKMDDNNPRIHITTPNGFELNLDDNNRKLRLGTPCGPEVVMECDGRMTISSGCAKITLDQCNVIIDANVQVNGHLTAQGIFAPNLCYCSSPGSSYSGTFSSSETKEKTKSNKCEPYVDKEGNTSCNGDFPPTPDGKLDDQMKKLLEEAKKIYKKQNKEDLKVCDAGMSPDRYNCLKNSGVSVPEQMVCGLGVQVVPHDGECDQNADPKDGTRLDNGCSPDTTINDSRAMQKIKFAESKKDWTYLGGTIPGLTSEQSACLAKILASSESSFVSNTVNSRGFLGEFQAGASALVEAGLVKPGTTSNSKLNDPSVWLNGLSKEKFLNNRQLQHDAFTKYVSKNVKNLGSRYTSARGCEKVALLSAAHLLGANGSKKLEKKDANGVTGEHYYDMALTACRRWTSC